MKKFKLTQGDVRTWILFFFGLGIAFGLFRRGVEPGPSWTILIGAFVGLGLVISPVVTAIAGKVRQTQVEGKDQPTNSSSSVMSSDQ